MMAKLDRPSKIQYSEQVDYLLLWIESAPLKIKNEVLEKLLSSSNLNQTNLLWTILQPVCHRDFFYSSQAELSESTPLSEQRTPNAPNGYCTNVIRKLLRHFLILKSMNIDNDIYFDNLIEYYRKILNDFEYLKVNNDSTSEYSLEDKNKSVKKRKTKSDKQASKSDDPFDRSKGMLKNSESFPLDYTTNENVSANNVQRWMSETEFLPHVIRFPKLPIRRHIQENSFMTSPLPQETVSSIVVPTPRNFKDKENALTQKSKAKKIDFIDSPSISNPSKNNAINTLYNVKNLNGKNVIYRVLKLTTSHNYDLKNNINIFKSPSKINFDSLTLETIKQQVELFIFWYTDVWTDLERNAFLRQLIMKLDSRQHYFIFSYLSRRLYRDFISQLPEKISVKILAYLTPKELVIAGRVCKSWKRFSETGVLWESKCRDVFYDIPESLTLVAGSPEWRKLFQKNEMLKKNWSTGKFRLVQVKGHTNSVLCVTMDDRLMATGSLDRSIKLWELQDGTLVKTLTGHSKGVWCVKFLTKYLLCSGSYDCSLKIWNIKSGVCNRTLFSHAGPIWGLCKQDGIMVSASQDKTAKVWDISALNLVFTLASHKEAVFCCDINRQTIATGSADKTIKLWNLFDGICFKTIYVSETLSVMSVSIDKEFIACSCNQTITIWKFEHTRQGYTARKIREYKEHLKRIECLRLKIEDAEKEDGIMASGGQDGLIKYWKLSKDKSYHTFAVHNGKRINCLAFDDSRIVSASFDNDIKVLNFGL